MNDQFKNNLEKAQISSTLETVKDTAEQYYNQTVDKAHDLYTDGKHKIHQTQQQLNEYSDQVIHLVKEKPMASLLVASGIGFLIAALLRK